MTNRELGQSGYGRRMTRLPPLFGRWLLLALLLLPISASAQFFDDQPTQRGRQSGFGAFGFPNQMQQPAFGGFGPEGQHPESPGLSRFPARPHVVHRPPPRI